MTIITDSTGDRVASPTWAKTVHRDEDHGNVNYTFRSQTIAHTRHSVRGWIELLQYPGMDDQMSVTFVHVDGVADITLPGAGPDALVDFLQTVSSLVAIVHGKTLEEYLPMQHAIDEAFGRS